MHIDQIGQLTRPLIEHELEGNIPRSPEKQRKDSHDVRFLQSRPEPTPGKTISQLLKELRSDQSLDRALQHNFIMQTATSEKRSLLG